MSGSNLSMAKNFSFTCNEIATDLNIENIPPYDKNSSIYKLYTKDEFKIVTNYFSKEVQTLHKSKLFAFYMNWKEAKKVLL